MPIYRKKPVTIEARCLAEHNGPEIGDWISDHGVQCDLFPDHLDIRTLEGTMRADLGDWVIKGVKGEFYPCKPDIFHATYEPVTDAPSDEDRIRDAMAEARDHPGRVVITCTQHGVANCPCLSAPADGSAYMPAVGRPGRIVTR